MNLLSISLECIHPSRICVLDHSRTSHNEQDKALVKLVTMASNECSLKREIWRPWRLPDL